MWRAIKVMLCARLRGKAVALALDPNDRNRNDAAHETEEGL